jgi:hypothetical protein
VINEEESDRSSLDDYVSPIFYDFDFDKTKYENPIAKLNLNIKSPRFEL